MSRISYPVDAEAATVQVGLPNIRVLPTKPVINLLGSFIGPFEGFQHVLHSNELDDLLEFAAVNVPASQTLAIVELVLLGFFCLSEGTVL